MKVNKGDEYIIKFTEDVDTEGDRCLGCVHRKKVDIYCILLCWVEFYDVYQQTEKFIEADNG